MLSLFRFGLILFIHILIPITLDCNGIVISKPFWVTVMYFINKYYNVYCLLGFMDDNMCITNAFNDGKVWGPNA